MKARTRVLSVVLAAMLLVMLFAVKPVAYAGNGFKDVPSNYWAAKQINYLAAKGIINGFPDGTFKPEQGVTREQFAKLVVVAKKLPLVKPATPTFSDVSPSRWSYPYVEAAAKAGYIKGIGGGKFGPTLGIRRCDLAVLLVRVLGKQAEAAKITEPVCFANDENKIPKYAVGAMTLAYNNHYQLLNYRTGRMAAPMDTATRAEVAKAIYMILVPPAESAVINLASGAEPDTLFQPLATVGASVDILTFTNAPMVGLNNKEEVFPYAITEVPSVDNGTAEVYTINGEKRLKVTVHLRKGLKWSDGTPVTSADAVFTEKMLADPKVRVVNRTASTVIAKVETPDKYTIVYYYKKIDPKFVLGRGLLPAHILKPIYDKDPAALNSCSFNEKPVTDGPYMVDKWVRGSYVRLVANPYYPWGKPLIKSVVVKYIPDANTRLANLIAGTVDVGDLNPEQAKVLSRNKNFVVTWQETEKGMTYIGVNCSNPFLADKRVRQAIAYAINREEYSKEVYDGKAGLCRGPIMKSSWAFYPKMKVYTYQPDKARQLLKEAGWTMGPDGILVNKEGKKFIVTLGSTTGSSSMKIVTFVQANLKQIGIKAIIKAYPLVTYYTRIVPRGQVDLYRAGWIEDPLFPGTLLSYRIDQIPTAENGWKGLNWSRWRNEEATKETILANASLSRAERRKHYWRFQQIFADEIPEIPWLERIRITAKKANLVNYVGTKGGVNRYAWNASYWYFEKK